MLYRAGLVTATLLIFLFPAKAKAQLYERGDFVIGPMYHNLRLGSNSALHQAYGLQASYFIHDRWSLEYSLAYTTVPFEPDYFKIYGGGLLAGYGTALGINNINTSSYWFITILCALVPEGVSYHFPLNDKITISPYINVASFDLSTDYLRLANQAGVRLNMIANKTVSVSPFAFVQLQYRARSVGGTRGGFGVGASVRFRF